MLKQYYVAVGTLEAKLPTLSELATFLAAASPRQPFGAAILCSSRDGLDAVAAELSLPSFKVYLMHADLELEERLAIASTMNQALLEDSGSENAEKQSLDERVLLGLSESWDAAEQASLLSDIRAQLPASTTPAATASAGGAAPAGHILLATDACFRSTEANAAFPNVDVLINYDLPVRKDVLGRRANLLRSWRAASGHRAQSASRIMVHVVVAGLVSDFRDVEQHAAALGMGPIEVMPVHIPDLFQ